MKTLLPFRSVSGKMLFPFLVIAVVYIVTVFASFTQINRIQRLSEERLEGSLHMGFHHDIAVSLNSFDENVEKFIVVGNESFREDAFTNLEEMSELSSKLEILSDHQHPDETHELEELLTRLENDLSLLSSGSEGSSQMSNSLLVDIYKTVERIEEINNETFKDNIRQSEESSQVSSRVVNSLINQSLILGLVILTITVTMYYTTRRSLLAPIIKLQKGSKRIAAGDYSLRITSSSEDEIGLLANSFNEMAERVKSREKSIEELNDVLQTINKILRHDVLNDLTVAEGNIDTYEEYGEPKEKDDLIKMMKKAIKRSKELIRRMKDMEMAIISDKPLDRRDIALEVNNAKENIDNLTVHMDSNAYVMADEALTSVFVNLFRNAKIHGDADEINVNVSEQDSLVEITVADNGKGISDDVKKQLFREGAKFGDTGNTGLGLYIVRKTVERYGGTVKVVDNKPSGAAFVLTIPAAPTA